MKDKLTGDELAVAETDHRSWREGSRIPLSRSWNQLEGRAMRDVQLKILIRRRKAKSHHSKTNETSRTTVISCQKNKEVRSLFTMSWLQEGNLIFHLVLIVLQERWEFFMIQLSTICRETNAGCSEETLREAEFEG